MSHRNELEHNLEKALRFFQAGFDTGHFYLARSEWSDAIPHLGCAFETSEILLTKSSTENEFASSCYWLTTSALLLASSFSYENYIEEAEDVIWMTINRLERQLAHNPGQILALSEHLEKLYSELKTYISDGSLTHHSSYTKPQISDVNWLIH
tara:strand:- start:59 stop:517 length:459 start_codon:yes stop_codon:yes gene_type:complete